MSLLQYDAGGLEYLQLITGLLQRLRVAEPDGGLWEAADLQWWWRRDRHIDPSNGRFWVAASGEPTAAVVFTDWGEHWGCDPIAADSDSALIRTLWKHALERMKQLANKPIEMTARDDDPLTLELLAESGFLPTEELAVACEMHSSDKPGIAPLAAGYRLMSTATDPTRPHHMIRRSGAHVAERLDECSLYQRSLDLSVVAPSGEIAAYGLFWVDPITGVGLVEPMRTEDEHQGRGLGRHVLTSGLDLLAAHGCSRLKITYIDGNDAAERLYRSAGFQTHSTSRTYRRDGPVI